MPLQVFKKRSFVKKISFVRNAVEGIQMSKKKPDVPESDMPGSKPVITFVALVKITRSSEPQFLHLYNGYCTS